MIRRPLLAAITLVAMGTALTGPAWAHNALSIRDGYAGYKVDVALEVNHGCKGSPVVGLRLKVPNGVYDAKAAFELLIRALPELGNGSDPQTDRQATAWLHCGRQA